MTARRVTGAARLVAAVGREPGLPPKTLAIRLGLTHSSTNRLLRALEDDGLVAFDRVTGGWFLTGQKIIGHIARVPPVGRAV